MSVYSSFQPYTLAEQYRTDTTVSPASSLSSSNPFSAISPKPRHHQPNGNVLSSSPNTFSSILNAKPQHQESDEDWTVEELEDDDEDERASVKTEVAKGPLVVYNRTELLKLAKKESVPQNMPTLDSWFGYVSSLGDNLVLMSSPWSPSKTAATPNYGVNHENEGYQRREAGVIGRGIGNSGRPRNNIGYVYNYQHWTTLTPQPPS